MKVFISWSGLQSRGVAEALRDWLPDLVQSVEPFMSNRDIRAGTRGVPEIMEQLSETKFGIVCLTPANQHKPWILFEAGALAKTLADAFVVPYLIGMEIAEIEGPLVQFNGVQWNKTGTWDLVHSMNKALGKDRLVPRQGSMDG